MKIFNIGFTKKSAEEFFVKLRQPGLNNVIDVRLNNSSQFTGFTKREDLRFFLFEIIGLDYYHDRNLAPTKELLIDYKNHRINWHSYERQYIDLLTNRGVGDIVQKSVIDGASLLCSEASPEYCHRRLVAEYFCSRWGDIDIEHL